MTKYSRNTWKKDALRQNMQSPRYGNGACNLCQDGAYPPDLDVHVSSGKTCGDVHLELSLLRKYQATCEAGQEKYRDMCCYEGSTEGGRQSLRTTGALIVALWFFWFFTKRIRTKRNPSLDLSETPDVYVEMGDSSGNSSSFESSSKRSKRSKAGVLKNLAPIIIDRIKSHSRSRDRSKSRERKTRATSRQRNERAKSRDRAQRTKSRERAFREPNCGRSSSRPKSRGRPMSTERPRRNPLPIQRPASRGRTRSQSRSRSRSRSRGRVRNDLDFRHADFVDISLNRRVHPPEKTGISQVV